MTIPLAIFEQVIDETILKRGFDYFKKGYISDFTEVSTGEYEATISGTEDYSVLLEIKSNTVVAHSCDCPYDMGPVCKHVAATIFYLQQDILDIDKKPASKPRAKRTKSVAQQIKELLKTISHDELMLFIEENSKSDKKFRATFVASFGHLSQDQSKVFYQKQISGILIAAKGRDSWIPWSNMKFVVKTTEPFLVNANKYFENKYFENVFYISTVLLEEFTEAFDFADDSNGDLGYFIQASMELLSNLSKSNLPEKLRTEFFDYCISTFNKKLFSGWDWHLDMIYLATQISQNQNEADIVIQCLDNFKGKYEKENAEFLKLDLLRKFKSGKEIQSYIDKHISNSSIRTDEIAKAFEIKNYDRAIKLSEDGIAFDKKEKPGLVKNWYNWLLKVAQAQKDTRKIIAYARYLFIDNFHPRQNYYQILKTTIVKEDWHPFLEQLIIDITPVKTRWTYTEQLREIYIKEQWWDRLFGMLKQNVSLGNIEQNEIHLSQDYNDELLELYADRISKYVEKYVGRNHYQTACRYLRRMKKLGGLEHVNGLIENFKVIYPQRKALMDELSRV